MHQTFIDAVIAGTARPEDFEDWFERWHEGAGGGLSAIDFLGLTRDEYAAWAECRTDVVGVVALAVARRKADVSS